MDHLFDYQKVGADFLCKNPAAFLADEQGLGKTIQVIAACDTLGLTKVVVICPAIAKINWRREFERWGTVEREVKVFSYDKITQSKEVRNEIAKFEPDVLVLDEAHYLKNRTAKRTKYLYGQYCRGDGLVKFADRVWLLSGTPIPNNVSDFWTHLKAIWQYPLNFAEYTTYFCKTWSGQFGLQILGNKTERMAEFKTVLKAIMLRRKGEVVLKDLPPIWWQDAPVEIDNWNDRKHIDDPRQAEAVDMILAHSLTNQDLSTEIESIAPHIASLRRLTGVAKAAPIATQIAGELADDAYDKIVIFAYHTDAIQTLYDKLKDFNPVVVAGGMPTADRQAAIDNFQTDPKVRVFIGQITACSTAITLTAANQVAFVEMDWVPATNAQAAKRCHRIGQTKPVIVRTFGLVNSVDEIVAKTLAKKAQMISEALD
jgi:SWI/SNF-related matrix-associated actin-dependent regulator 1 of chromatin subfamily A